MGALKLGKSCTPQRCPTIWVNQQNLSNNAAVYSLEGELEYVLARFSLVS